MARGETGQYIWDYSERSDILNIHRKNRPIQGGVELGDLTIDFDAQGRIVGLEIMNVSELFSRRRICRLH